jgi:hypothetical protein
MTTLDDTTDDDRQWQTSPSLPSTRDIRELLRELDD